uniref:Uncharacterized protein n=1 Tax=Rousettus aegyptiacus TaxID=9407 RepID=A0A7J8FIN4_ROUAE|nr:hypothetical protein HJG63_011970 [Rousettus aegyptiacus]
MSRNRLFYGWIFSASQRCQFHLCTSLTIRKPVLTFTRTCFMTTLSLYSHKYTLLRIRFKNRTHSFIQFGESPASHELSISQTSSGSGSKNKFITASIPVITQDSASQACSVPDSPAILIQYSFDGDSNSARQEVRSFVIYLANISLLGHVACASTRRAPANTHAHRLSMCSTSKINTLPHRKLLFIFHWGPHHLYTLTSKLQFDKPLSRTP